MNWQLATVDSRFPGNGAFGATYRQFLAFSFAYFFIHFFTCGKVPQINFIKFINY